MDGEHTDTRFAFTSEGTAAYGTALVETQRDFAAADVDRLLGV